MFLTSSFSPEASALDERQNKPSNEEKSVKELLTDMQQDNKIDGKDKEDMNELSQRLTKDTENMYKETKEALKGNIFSLLEG